MDRPTRVRILYFWLAQSWGEGQIAGNSNSKGGPTIGGWSLLKRIAEIDYADQEQWV